MDDFVAKSVCILGRQPALALAELESLYGHQHVKAGESSAAFLDIDGFDINFQNLGGTIKVARILTTLPSNKWDNALNYLTDKIPGHLKHLEEGKFTLGVSLYGINVEAGKLNRDLLHLKQVIKKSGRSARIVPNKTPALSSAQVLHNKLTRRGAWELLLIKSGQDTILAQTLFVQDIEAYAARDQVRPARDARVGMLPPKLAQILINLAVGQFSNSQLAAGISPKAKYQKPNTILDPFCGTGVILQESLLMGHTVIGTDIEPRMVEYSQKNLDWLSSKLKVQNSKFKVYEADATSYKWPSGFDTVVSELYLGRPLNKLPMQEDLQKIINDVNTISEKFLKNLAGQVKSGARVSLAVPAWIDGKNITHLPLVDHLSELGYNRYDFVHVKTSDLVYFREGQTVARELLVLTKI